MYRNLTTVILLMLLITDSVTYVSAQGAGQKPSRWTDVMYEQYTYNNYTDYTAFVEPIDLTAIDTELLEAAIFYETNRQRATHERAPLMYDHNLRMCAHNHSADMTELNFFDHNSPVAGKETFYDRLEQVGYKDYTCAENIVMCTLKASYAETARYMVEEKWMKSKGHRTNILRTSLTHLGCGASVYRENGNWYVKATQNFLKKL